MAQVKKRYSLRGKMIGVNFVTTLSALLLCGGVFILSVWAIIGEYINHDINFFMTATADSLQSDLEFCEDVIYGLRDDEQVMKLMKLHGNERTRSEREQLQEAFEEAVDISSQSILGAGTVPLIEAVYAFSEEKIAADTSYYAIIYSEAEQNSRLVTEIYEKFREENREDTDKSYGYYLGEDERIYLVFPLYDDNLETAANLVFKIREDALQLILQDMEGYQDSFWALCDREGQYVAGKRAQGFQKDSGAILQQCRYQPYTQVIERKSYRVYRKQLCMNLQIVIGIPENQAMALMYDSVKIYMVFIVLIMAGAGILFFLIIYRLTKPIKEIAYKLEEVRKGEFETKLPEYDSREFHEISEVFNDMTAYVNHLIKQVYEKQISIKEMELKFLQTQMNPHFMFNVLSTIALQAKLDRNEEVYKMISSFSQLIQAKIYRSDREKVMVSQELEYVEYYLYLQSYRFGEHLEYAIEVKEEALKQLYIPKLCIQLIVENAVVHGIEPKMENGRVVVKIDTEDDILLIQISDNGVGFETDGEIMLPMKETEDASGHNHVGLNNAHHIIQLSYGEEYGISVHSRKGSGTVVTVRIPFDYGNQCPTERTDGGQNV